MYCSKCGSELKHDARFCSKCGAPAKTPDADKSTNKDNISTSVDLPTPPSEQLESGKKPTNRKISPFMILVIVLAVALAAGAGIAMINTTTHPAQNPQTGQQSQASKTEQELSPEEKERQQTLALVDGWWASGSVNSGRQWNVCHFDAGKVTVYGILDGNPKSVSQEEITSMEHVDSVEPDLMTAQGNRADTAGKPGYRVTLSSGGTLYLADGDSNNLLDKTRTGALARIDTPDWAPANGELYDQARAEAAARTRAETEGKQIFTGTVEIISAQDRARQVAPRIIDNFSSMKGEMVLLIISEPTQITAMAGDGDGMNTRTGNSLYISKYPDAWRELEGQTVTVAIDENKSWWPSDVVGVLYSVNASDGIQRIAPLALEQTSSTSTSASNSSPDYILPESATREYSESELRALDVHTLFLARNEIYARHGRQFKSEELQQYFGSKSWYHGTIPADSFDEESVSAVEKANAKRMLAIEESMGSPYI